MVKEDLFEDVADAVSADILVGGKERKVYGREVASGGREGDNFRAMLLHRGDVERSDNDLQEKRRKELGFSNMCTCVLISVSSSNSRQIKADKFSGILLSFEYILS